MFTAINNALRMSMEKDDKIVIFGEDVAFKIFRCTTDLREQFGNDTLINSLAEQGIMVLVLVWQQWVINLY